MSSWALFWYGFIAGLITLFVDRVIREVLFRWKSYHHNRHWRRIGDKAKRMTEEYLRDQERKEKDNEKRG